MFAIQKLAAARKELNDVTGELAKAFTNQGRIGIYTKTPSRLPKVGQN